MVHELHNISVLGLHIAFYMLLLIHMILYNIYFVATPVLQCSVTLAWLRVQYSRAFVCEYTALGLCLELWPSKCVTWSQTLELLTFNPEASVQKSLVSLSPSHPSESLNMLSPSPSHIFLFISLVLFIQWEHTPGVLLRSPCSYSTYSWGCPFVMLLHTSQNLLRGNVTNHVKSSLRENETWFYQT